MFIVTLSVMIPPERRIDFIDAARTVVGPTRVQPGCIRCQFYQDMEDPNAAFLIEEWESREALDDHFKSEEYRIILSLIELSSDTPEFKLSSVSKTEGLEAVASSRTGNA